MIIESDKIYTSYYRNGNLHFERCICISLGVPNHLKNLLNTYFDLCPNYETFKLYKDKMIPFEEFSRRYKIEVLDKLNPNKVYDDLKGKILLCHEKPKKNCHRHLITKWLSDNISDLIIGGEL